MTITATTSSGAICSGVDVPDENDRLVILCDCHDKEHQFWLEFDPKEEDNAWDNMYLSPHLGNVGWWRRLQYAWRYLWGRKSRYGAFAEVILSRPQVEQIRDLCNRYLDK